MTREAQGRASILSTLVASMTLNSIHTNFLLRKDLWIWEHSFFYVLGYELEIRFSSIGEINITLLVECVQNGC